MSLTPAIMEACKAKIVAHKGHLTRVLKSAKRLIPFAILNPSPEAAHDLEDILAGLRKHHAAIMSAYLALQLVTTDQVAQDAQDVKILLVEDSFM
jgi:hypothetical protein